MRSPSIFSWLSMSSTSGSINRRRSEFRSRIISGRAGGGASDGDLGNSGRSCRVAPLSLSLSLSVLFRLRVRDCSRSLPDFLSYHRCHLGRVSIPLEFWVAPDSALTDGPQTAASFEVNPRVPSQTPVVRKGSTLYQLFRGVHAVRPNAEVLSSLALELAVDAFNKSGYSAIVAKYIHEVLHAPHRLVYMRAEHGGMFFTLEF